MRGASWRRASAVCGGDGTKAKFRLTTLDWAQAASEAAAPIRPTHRTTCRCRAAVAPQSASKPELPAFPIEGITQLASSPAPHAIRQRMRAKQCQTVHCHVSATRFGWGCCREGTEWETASSALL